MGELRNILFTASYFLYNIMSAQAVFQEDFNASYFPANWTVSPRIEKALALGKGNSGYIRFHPKYQQQSIETPLITVPAGNYALLFDWNKAGNSNEDSVLVEVSETNGSSWQAVYTIFNGNNRTWQPDSVALNNIGGNIKLRWKYFSVGIFPSQYFNLDNVVLKSNTPTFIKQNISDISFTLFPNPNNGIFQIRLNNPALKNGTLQITDVKGSVVYKQPLPAVIQSLIQLDKSGFSKGIYTIRLQTAAEVISKNVIIQ
ncbi:MAG: T9SS type A sorting domain-containing protein [Sphingobacteriales bacterium]|jgi:hypothetical protein|nr:T9SS type A sorting domain-containing protein [Sphingobacteriales bacterium]